MYRIFWHVLERGDDGYVFSSICLLQLGGAVHCLDVDHSDIKQEKGSMIILVNSYR